MSFNFASCTSAVAVDQPFQFLKLCESKRCWPAFDCSGLSSFKLLVSSSGWMPNCRCFHFKIIHRFLVAWWGIKLSWCIRKLRTSPWSQTFQWSSFLVVAQSVPMGHGAYCEWHPSNSTFSTFLVCILRSAVSSGAQVHSSLVLLVVKSHKLNYGENWTASHEAWC